MALSKKAAQKNKKNPGKSFFQGVKVELKKVVMAIIGVADGVFGQLFNLLRAVVG